MGFDNGALCDLGPKVIRRVHLEEPPGCPCRTPYQIGCLIFEKSGGSAHQMVRVTIVTTATIDFQHVPSSAIHLSIAPEM
jgi:hypothetical protein